MKVSFLLENKTTEFYEKLAGMSAQEQWQYLTKVHKIKPVIGDNSTISECVEFNIKMKQTPLNLSVLEVRKGYRVLRLSF